MPKAEEEFDVGFIGQRRKPECASRHLVLPTCALLPLTGG
jgi:hypothetical protein